MTDLLQLDLFSEKWNKMFGESRYQYTTDVQDDHSEIPDDLVECLESQIKANKMSKSWNKLAEEPAKQK